MSITKDQRDCLGHDWDCWDVSQKKVYVDVCQSCWVDKDDWLEHVEAENAKLREELQHHYGSSDCSCEPWEVEDE